ncbi:hypothetical protein [[Mycoplasma] gypis]|uniref:Septation ring formation regulator n=1 Tax=[Mycoplasma] gypis TaxID=92404 RepID=A0ABZ2RN79_9BACT|nr:hypothetical protein [[Mycoplasma] gypis]MBN0919632.1 hypothetical protein [[Mycoplasma] gypis]
MLLLFSVVIFIYNYFKTYALESIIKKRNIIEKKFQEISSISEKLELFSKSSQNYQKIFETFLEMFSQIEQKKNTINFKTDKLRYTIAYNFKKILKVRIKNFWKIYQDIKEIKKEIRVTNKIIKKILKFSNKHTEKPDVILSHYQKHVYFFNELKGTFDNERKRYEFFADEIRKNVKEWVESVSYFSNDSHLNDVQKQNNIKLFTLNKIILKIAITMSRGVNSLDFVLKKFETFFVTQNTKISKKASLYKNVIIEQNLKELFFEIKQNINEIKKLFELNNYYENRVKIDNLISKTFEKMINITNIFKKEESAFYYFENFNLIKFDLESKIITLNNRIFQLEKDWKIYQNTASNKAKKMFDNLKNLTKKNYFNELKSIEINNDFSYTHKLNTLNTLIKNMSSSFLLIKKINEELNPLNKLFDKFQSLEKTLFDIKYNVSIFDIIISPNEEKFIEKIFILRNIIVKNINTQNFKYEELNEKLNDLELLIEILKNTVGIKIDANKTYRVSSQYFNSYRLKEPKLSAVLEHMQYENNSANYVKTLRLLKEYIETGEN